VARPGNGRHSRASRQQISERLTDIDVDLTADELDVQLQRLVDVGKLQLVQIASGMPIHYVVAETRTGDFSEEDTLEADIVAAIRSRGYNVGFEDDWELSSWLETAGVQCTDREFARAVGHLRYLGRRRKEIPAKGEPDRWHLVDAEVIVTGYGWP
jgi:hypothetical protein